MRSTFKNKMKNLKLTTSGFTLIELLAVIVILAIIALIATPIVLSIINDTKKSAIKQSAEFYEKALEQSISTSILDDKNIPDGVYNILENGNMCLENYNKTTKKETTFATGLMNGNIAFNFYF